MGGLGVYEPLVSTARAFSNRSDASKNIKANKCKQEGRAVKQGLHLYIKH